MTVNIKIGIVMDYLGSINPKKDSSIAMILEAQNRGYKVYYMEVSDLYLIKNDSRARIRQLTIQLKKNQWFYLCNEKDISLSDLDVILMRKNPPLDIEFLYATYILENAEKKGTIVINKPQSLRDCNEKIFTTHFTELIPDTLVTNNIGRIIKFLKKHKDIILKPLNKMGGASIFRIKENDTNTRVIVEYLTNYNQSYCMAQKFLTEIKKGDKRILVVDGTPIPYCLARFPKNDDNCGNLAAGGEGKVQELSCIDLNIVNKVSQVLKKKGLIFVGLDIIGDKLTEINITSPTCIKEIEYVYPKISISGMLMDTIEKIIFKKLK